MISIKKGEGGRFFQSTPHLIHPLIALAPPPPPVSLALEKKIVKEESKTFGILAYTKGLFPSS